MCIEYSVYYFFTILAKILQKIENIGERYLIETINQFYYKNVCGEGTHLFVVAIFPEENLILGSDFDHFSLRHVDP